MTDVFISYARVDQAFVRRLHAALAERGKDAWVDWEDIPASARWQDELRTAIEAADAFCFVISPDSVASAVCRQEAEHALAAGKRIIPLLWREVAQAAVPEPVAVHNWISLRATDDFEAGLGTLIAALETDLAWVKEHTRLLGRALEWERASRDGAFLLRGRDLEAAEARLAGAAELTNPRPTPLMVEYAIASRRQATRGQRTRVGALAGGLVLALVLAGFALVQLQDAVTQRSRAEQATGEAQANATEAEKNAAEARANASEAAANASEAARQQGIAQQRATEAEAQRKEAETQRSQADAAPLEAQARELSAASSAQLSRDPELSLLLATKAVELLPNADADQALRRAIESSHVRGRYVGHNGPVRSVSVTADGRRMATGSDDGTVQVWNIADGRILLTVRPDVGRINSARISPDGNRLAAALDSGSVLIWNATTGALERTIVAHSREATDLVFSPDSTRLLSVGWDGGIRLWNVATGVRLLNLPALPEAGLRVANFASDGTRFVTAGVDRIAHVWDTATGDLLRTVVGHTNTIWDAVFSPDGTLLATASSDETIRVWNLATGIETETLRGHASAVLGLAFSDDGSLLASTGLDGAVRLWNVSTGADMTTLTGHDGGVDDVAFVPGSDRILTAGEDRTVRSWAVASFDTLVKFPGHSGGVVAGSFSPDGSRVLTAGSDGLAVINDAATGDVLTTLRGHEFELTGGQFSPDGTRVVTSSSDGTARVWDVATGREGLRLAADAGTVHVASFDAAGQMIVTGDDAAARVWNASTGAPGLRLEVGVPVTGALFSADGNRVITGDQNGNVTLWDRNDGHRVGSLAAAVGPILAVSISPDGSRLAVLGSDAAAEVWDLPTASLALHIRTPYSYGWQIHFSRDGTRLVTGGDDGTAHVWSIENGELLANLPTSSRDVFDAYFSPDGTSILTTTREGTSALYRCPTCGSTAAALDLARGRVTRTFTVAERTSLLHEAPTSSPAPTPSPGATANPPAAPTPAPVAAGDICDAIDGPCSLAAGTYRPSLFHPMLSFELAAPASGDGQLRGSIGIRFERGDYISLMDAATTYGAQQDSAIVIGPKPDHLFQYLHAKPWLRFSDERDISVGGRPARSAILNSDSTQQVLLGYADVAPFGWTPGETMRVVAVDIGDTSLWILVDKGGESLPEFNAFVDAFLDSIRFE